MLHKSNAQNNNILKLYIFILIKTSIHEKLVHVKQQKKKTKLSYVLKIRTFKTNLNYIKNS